MDLKAELNKIKLCCGIPPPPGSTDVFYPRLQAFTKEPLVRISKKHFSLFKSVRGDHLGLKCKNNYGKSIKGSTTKGSYEFRFFKGAS